jgi:hypothetical protein
MSLEIDNLCSLQLECNGKAASLFKLLLQGKVLALPTGSQNYSAKWTRAGEVDSIILL